jgi:electron transfer flavoprotein alpha subunit
LVALVLGENVSSLTEAAIQYGADQAIVANDAALKYYRPGPYAALTLKAVQQVQPAALLLGASSAGLELSAYVAAKLGVGLAPDAIDITVEGERLIVTRPVLVGNLAAKVEFGPARPQVVTIRRRVYPVPEKNSGRTGEINPLEANLNEAEIATKVEGHEAATNEVSLNDARIIVSGGRGVGGPEGFAPIKALADALGGAMGASRVAVDAGWIPYKHQVGQTGKTVQPDLYIACGISGAIQHLAGMKTAKVIVVINKDAEAPIMNYAHYAIIGDLFQIVPALTEEFKRRLGK